MLKGVHCVRGNIEMPEHIRCQAQEIGPPCGIPPTILQLIVTPSQERIDAGVKFSPSSIHACHRQTALTQDHDWFLDVKHGYKPTRGTIVHEGLSREPPWPGILGVVRELRMSAPMETKYGEQLFQGKADEITLLSTNYLPDTREEVGGQFSDKNWVQLHVKIADYKTRSEVRHDLLAADEDHVRKINEYSWLVQRFLPGYLNACMGYGDPGGCVEPNEHLFLAPNLTSFPRIDEVIVDELSITYLDMSRVRTFTSRGFLYDEGKMLSDVVKGRSVRRNPVEHEELELTPIHVFRPKYVERMIKKGIEDQIEGETLLAPPLTGLPAKIQCTNCAVRQVCYDLGKQEGYDMEAQKPYVTLDNT